MDFMEAMAWADDHKDVAKKWFNKFGYMSPYGLEDFQQIVLESAITASIVLGDKPQPEFEAIFVRTLQNGMSTLIPGYGFKEGQKGGVGPNVSMSIHSNNCISYHSEDLFTEIADEESELGFLDSLSDKDDFVNPAYNAEHAYSLVEQHLDDRQKTVLTHSLGLTEKGALSAREIEKETSISKSTVSRDLSKIFSFVTDLVTNGVIAVFSPLPSPSPFEFELRRTVAETGLSCQMFASDSSIFSETSVRTGFFNSIQSDGYFDHSLSNQTGLRVAADGSFTDVFNAGFSNWISALFKSSSETTPSCEFDRRPTTQKPGKAIHHPALLTKVCKVERFGVVWRPPSFDCSEFDDSFSGCITRGDPRSGVSMQVR